MQITLDLYALLFIIVTTAIAAVYCVDSWRKRTSGYIIPLVLSVITVYCVLLLLQPGSAQFYTQLSLGAGIAIISTILAAFYITRPMAFLPVMALLIAASLLYILTYPGSMLFAGMFGIGTMYGLTYRSIRNRSSPLKLVKKRKSTEVNRDLIHILLGIILVAVLFSTGFTRATEIIFGLILLGYIANNILSTNRLIGIYKRILPLERSNVVYGAGAMHLAAGAALIIGFIPNFNFAMFGIIALFFADPIATIVGLNLSRAKIPFNREKTVAGSLAFFAVAAVLGYPFVGIYSISFGIILAIIESLNILIDDNIRVGVVTVLLYALISL
ncbi:MAG: hypothetical protein KGH60_02585 [Candidatus Micrarchaeota archaeon]|nr:hypothetical protein [Candidatus Micrarchaeota archaeon]